MNTSFPTFGDPGTIARLSPFAILAAVAWSLFLLAHLLGRGYTFAVGARA